MTEDDNDNNLDRLLVPLIAGLGFGVMYLYGAATSDTSFKAHNNYVHPVSVRIEQKDMDKNRSLETYLEFKKDGNTYSYLLMWNDQQKELKLYPYDLVPERVIQKKVIQTRVIPPKIVPKER